MIATLNLSELDTAEEFPEFSEEFRNEITEVCRMLADASRLKILFFLLRTPELNVTEICERLSQSQPAVSHHLALLKQARLLQVRRDGKHNYYSICRERFHAIMVRLFDSILDPAGGPLRIENFLLSHVEAASSNGDGTDARP